MALSYPISGANAVTNIKLSHIKDDEERIILIKGKEKESVFEEIISGQGLQYPITKLLSSNSNWIIGT